jgi:septal ring factor EnvC (AmiA/AmiB activator)
MDVKIIAGIVLTLVIAVALFYSSFKEARKSPDQKYKEKQERLKKKNEEHRQKMDMLTKLHPGLRAIDKEIARLNDQATERMKNDPKTQEFLLKLTKDKLSKKTKQRLLNIAKKDLKIEIDPSLKKNEIVEKIYVDYHNLKGWDSPLKDAFK